MTVLWSLTIAIVTSVVCSVHHLSCCELTVFGSYCPRRCPPFEFPAVVLSACAATGDWGGISSAWGLGQRSESLYFFCNTTCIDIHLPAIPHVSDAPESPPSTTPQYQTVGLIGSSLCTDRYSCLPMAAGNAVSSFLVGSSRSVCSRKTFRFPWPNMSSCCRYMVGCRVGSYFVFYYWIMWLVYSELQITIYSHLSVKMSQTRKDLTELVNWCKCYGTGSSSKHWCQWFSHLAGPSTRAGFGHVYIEPAQVLES